MTIFIAPQQSLLDALKTSKEILEEQGINMTLPTYHEFTKDWSLVEKLKFHYDVDLDNFTGDVWDLVANVASNRDWLNEFYREFEENLREREYIR
tara:strand:+ start:89 stop:373 length:285 start_codon:yes stop_codon:yes gene_type:complete